MKSVASTVRGRTGLAVATRSRLRMMVCCGNEANSYVPAHEHSFRLAAVAAPRSRRPQQAMTDTPNKPVKESAATRQDRLRQALRENLKRRKSQSRGRASLADDQVAAVESAATPTQQDICSRPVDPNRD